MKSTLIFFLLFTNFLYAQNTTFFNEDLKSINKVLELATADDKKVLLYFEGNNCPPCRKLKKVTFTDEKVLSAMSKDYLAFNLNEDFTDYSLLKQTYRVQSNPSLIFINASGKVLQKEARYIDPKEFVSLLKDIQKGKNSQQTLEEEYKKKSKDLDFMVAYMYHKRDIGDIDTLMLRETLGLIPEDRIGDKEIREFVSTFLVMLLDQGFVNLTYSTHPAVQELIHHGDPIDSLTLGRLMLLLETERYELNALEDEEKVLEIAAWQEQIEPLYPTKVFEGGLAIFTPKMQRIGIIIGSHHGLSTKLEYYQKVGLENKYQEVYENLKQIHWNSFDNLENLVRILKTNEHPASWEIDAVTLCEKRMKELEEH
jgi:thioredoxin-related protein